MKAINQKQRNKALGKAIGLNVFGLLIFLILGFGGSASAKKEYENRVNNLEDAKTKLENLQLEIAKRDSLDNIIVSFSDSINKYHQQFINQVPQKPGSTLLDPKMNGILDDLKTSKDVLEDFMEVLNTKNEIGNKLVLAYKNLCISNSTLAANINVTEKNESGNKSESPTDCRAKIDDLEKKYETKVNNLEGRVSFLNGKIERLCPCKSGNKTSQSNQKYINELIQDIRPIAQKAEESVGGFLKLKRKDKALKDIANELNQIIDYYTSK